MATSEVKGYIFGSREPKVKIEDLTHQSQFLSWEELKGFLNMQNQSNNNPPKDPVDRKESDMSIGTHPGEEFMQGHQMIRASE